MTHIFSGFIIHNL